MKSSNEETNISRHIRLIRVPKTQEIEVDKSDAKLYKVAAARQQIDDDDEPPEKKFRQTGNKENKILRKAIKKTNTKSKASKKLVLVPGQKTLKQFFM